MRSAEPKQASSFFFKGTEANAKMASYSLGPYFVVTYCSSIPHDQSGIMANATTTTTTPATSDTRQTIMSRWRTLTGFDSDGAGGDSKGDSGLDSDSDSGAL